MRKLVVLVALFLCPALSAGNIDKKLPDLSRTVATGCYITHIQDVRTQKPVWELIVWARYAGSPKGKEDWRLWYSNRNKRTKAFKDCDYWLRIVVKKIRAVRSK